ncbi:MAG: molybdopterin-dependent oxidoreductase [Leptolyngbyaceae cyanobacterium bins.302]|nr:molybdopterin-dependent oxidoreductase [Leptolyngbyaceae cyanobacterium bins.302]
MQRRTVIQRLLQTSGGLIGANLLASCGKPLSLDAMFAPNLLDPREPLPPHLLTPVSEFYVQSYASPMTVDVAKWQLEFTGAIANSITLSLNDILAAPQKEFYLTMECIGNQAGGDQIGNALWQGTPLLPFLKQVQVQPEATHFMLHAADYYETTLPVADLMRPDVCLVHRMNQAPLTPEHGYPVRIIIPGRFGQKQPKWLIKIEAISQPKKGYWERQGWSNTAEIPTHSMIRQVQSDRVWHRRNSVNLPKTGTAGWANGILIAGIALDKSSSIASIQVSTDNGQQWHVADQNRPPSPHEWTLWRYLWKPTQPGQHTLLAIARSANQTQPLSDSDRMDGSSGALRIQVNLTA